MISDFEETEPGVNRERPESELSGDAYGKTQNPISGSLPAFDYFGCPNQGLAEGSLWPVSGYFGG
jgi:hypothetical protein